MVLKHLSQLLKDHPQPTPMPEEPGYICAPSFDKYEVNSISSESYQSQLSMDLIGTSSFEYSIDPSWQIGAGSLTFIPENGMQVEGNMSSTQDPFYQKKNQLACLSSDSQIAPYEAANPNWDGSAMEVEGTAYR